MTGRTLLATVLTLTVTFGTAGCADKTGPKSKKPTVATAAPPDCDRDDRGHKETPDCGFVSGGRYYEWTWVQAGDTTAPPNWDAEADRKRVLSGR